MEYDLVIRNGRVIDGSGMPSYTGDVAVKDGRIVGMGKLDGAVQRTIDAGGRVIAPGIVDIHCHFDAQALWDPLCTFSCFHGVTTVVFGNCSLALAPVRRDAHEQYMLAQMLSRVEAIPMEVLEAGVDWSWSSIPEYLNALDRRLGINVGYLIGHSAVRRYVMGEDSQERAASDDEIEEMKEIIREGMAAGAAGISLDRNRGHLDLRGKSVPGSIAPTEELYALAEVLREFGAGVIQCGAATRYELEEEMCTRLFQISGRPVIYNGISHFWVDPDRWKGHLEFVEATVKRGNLAYPQLNPRPTYARFTMKNCQLFDQFPTWRPIMDGPLEERIAALGSPSLRRQLHAEAVEGPAPLDIGFNKRWDLLFVARTTLEKNSGLKGKSIAQIAEARGADVLDVFLDLAVEEGLETQFVSNTSGGDEQVMTQLLTSPYPVLGASDSGAHIAFDPGYGSSTYFLRHWVGDKHIMPLEEGVRKLTFVPATLFGLHDRGLLWPGFAADIVVFDPDKLDLQEMEEVHDLPGGGARLKQLSEGIEWTIVNGQVLIERGEHTGAYPGRVLRNGHTAGAALN